MRESQEKTRMSSDYSFLIFGKRPNKYPQNTRQGKDRCYECKDWPYSHRAKDKMKGCRLQKV